MRSFSQLWCFPFPCFATRGWFYPLLYFIFWALKFLSIYLYSILKYLFIWLHQIFVVVCGIRDLSIPDQGSNLGPTHWVLATGPPGKSLECLSWKLMPWILANWWICFYRYTFICGREGNGTPLQYSCLENPMDGGAWWAAVHGVAKSGTRLSINLWLVGKP